MKNSKKNEKMKNVVKKILAKMSQDEISQGQNIAFYIGF